MLFPPGPRDISGKDLHLFKQGRCKQRHEQTCGSGAVARYPDFVHGRGKAQESKGALAGGHALAW
jgi:hypothetical protein